MTRRQNILLCYPFEEKRLLKWGFPALCQPKLDGVRCRAVPDKNGWTLYSSEAKEIISCPHIVNELNQLPDDLWVELDGEIYNHNLDFDLISGITSRTKNLHERYVEAEFHVFDVADEFEPQIERVNKFYKLIGFNYLKRVETQTAHTVEQVMEWFDWFVEQGYEGIVVRHPLNFYKRQRSLGVMKFKPHQADWFEIHSYKEEIDKHGNPKNRLGAFVCKDDNGETFSVGSGLTDQQREQMWSKAPNLIGKYLKVKYQARNPNSIPRFPVFVEIDEVSREGRYNV